MRRKDKPTARKQKSPPFTVREALEAAPKPPKHQWRPGFGDKGGQMLRTARFKRWQLQEAKAKFSALFDRALDQGPQVVTRHNKEAVVVLSADEYSKLAGGPEKSQPGMLETLLQCPKGPDLKIDRDRNATVLDLPRILE